MHKFHFLLLLFPLLYSCEEPLDRELDIPRAQLVVSSTFFPDQYVRVGLSSTFSILDSDQAVSVPNAIINIFSGNQLLEQLTYVDTGQVTKAFYTTQEFKPTIGVTYTLHVSAPGFDPVTAVSSIPPPVPIRHFHLDRLTKRTEEDYNIYNVSLAFDYDDPEGEVNFYNLRVFQRSKNFVVAYNGDTIYTNYSLSPIAFSESPQGLYKRAANAGGILFQDRPEQGPLHIHYETIIDPRAQKLDKVYAELRTVSPEYYYYQRSISQQGGATIGSGLTPSSVIQTNVENGNGVFAGYASSSDSLKLLSF